MAMTMQVDVVSAEELIYSGVAEFIAVPAENGEIGVLPRHAPMLSKMRPGAVRIKAANVDDEVVLFVSGGLLEVQTHSVTILADTAIRGGDIDEAKALDAKRRAEEALQNRASNIDFAMAQSELMEAIAKLRVVDKIKHRA
jgi:F-type H+-transporting ATPase subunit epsilon